jgi:hypothetical protein
MVKSIKIPRTPKSAYDPTRKVSNLLRAHIANLEAVTVRRTPAMPTRKPRTERQASAYIAELTAQLKPESVAAPPAAYPVAARPMLPNPAAASPANKKSKKQTGDSRTARAGKPARKPKRRGGRRPR